MNKEQFKEIISESLNRYIKERHTQDECIGFIDGMKEGYRIAIETIGEINATNTDKYKKG